MKFSAILLASFPALHLAAGLPYRYAGHEQGYDGCQNGPISTLK